MLDDEVASPTGAIYTYRFGPRGDMPPVTLTWYDGGLRPPAARRASTPTTPSSDWATAATASMFIGDKGHDHLRRLGGHAPAAAAVAAPASTSGPTRPCRASKGHHADWLAACKGGPPASGNFEYSARLTELVLLGSVALRSQEGSPGTGRT